MTEHYEENNNQGGEPGLQYYQAARFASQQRALTVYAVLQETLLDTECDLSSYRFLLNDISHVVALGEQPPVELHESISQILAGGEPVSLPNDVLQLLQERRREQSQLGPWVEGYYEPGIAYHRRWQAEKEHHE